MRTGFRRDPLVVMLINGREARIRSWYREGPFALHRGIGCPGWTVTHLGTNDAVIRELPTLSKARQVAHELMRLTPKWGARGSRYGLWRIFHRSFNVREKYAIHRFMAELRQAYGTKP